MLSPLGPRALPALSPSSHELGPRVKGLEGVSVPHASDANFLDSLASSFLSHVDTVTLSLNPKSKHMVPQRPLCHFQEPNSLGKVGSVHKRWHFQNMLICGDIGWNLKQLPALKKQKTKKNKEGFPVTPIQQADLGPPAGPQVGR